MIDIWMIFTMTFPLLEVALHTYKETLKMKLNQFRDDDTTSMFTKVQPMEQLNGIETPPSAVQRFERKWKCLNHFAGVGWKGEWGSVSIFWTECSLSLLQVSCYFFTQPTGIAGFSKIDSLFRIHSWLLCYWDLGSFQLPSRTLQLLLIDERIFVRLMSDISYKKIMKELL